MLSISELFCGTGADGHWNYLERLYGGYMGVENYPSETGMAVNGTWDTGFEISVLAHKLNCVFLVILPQDHIGMFIFLMVSIEQYQMLIASKFSLYSFNWCSHLCGYQYKLMITAWTLILTHSHSSEYSQEFCWYNLVSY